MPLTNNMWQQLTDTHNTAAAMRPQQQLQQLFGHKNMDKRAEKAGACLEAAESALLEALQRSFLRGQRWQGLVEDLTQLLVGLRSYKARLQGSAAASASARGSVEYTKHITDKVDITVLSPCPADKLPPRFKALDERLAMLDPHDPVDIHPLMLADMRQTKQQRYTYGHSMVSTYRMVWWRYNPGSRAGGSQHWVWWIPVDSDIDITQLHQVGLVVHEACALFR